MAFPASYDTITTTPSGSDPLLTGTHTDIHTQLKTLLEAIETKLGINSSTDPNSIDYKLQNTTNGHNHDGANSRQILATNLDPTGFTPLRLVQLNAGGTQFQSASVRIGTTTANQLVEVDATGAILQSSGKTKPSGAIVGTTDNQTLTNKIYDVPVIREWDGWVTCSDTWTYVGANSFKVTGSDVTAKYYTGLKIKLTDGSTKYGYVVSSTFAVDTTVTIVLTNGDTLSGGAITNPFYSYNALPRGFNGKIYCAVKRTSVQSLNNATTTSVQFNGEETDTLNMHDNVTNPDRITVPFAGVYRVHALLRIEDAAAGNLVMQFYKNGVAVPSYGANVYEMFPGRDSSGRNYIDATLHTTCAAGDYLTISAQQNSGISKNILFAQLDAELISIQN